MTQNRLVALIITRAEYLNLLDKRKKLREKLLAAFGASSVFSQPANN